MGRRPEPPPRRLQHAAMRDVEANDDPRQRARAGRGVKSSDRSGSPPRGHRHHSGNEARQRQSTRPEPSLHPHRHTSPDRGRDRDRDRERHHSHRSTSRRPEESEDLIPRYREKKLRDQEVEDTRRRRSRSRDRDRDRDRERDRPGPTSPSSSKRHRSRSRSPSSRQRKKPKRHSSPSRRDRHIASESGSKHRRRHSPHGHRRSPPPPHASPGRSDDHSSRFRRARGSESPTAAGRDPRPVRRDSRRRGSVGPRQSDRSRSPRRSSRASSRSRPLAPHDVDSRLPPGSANRDHYSSEFDRREDHRSEAPRSPKAHRDRDRRRRRESPEPYTSTRSDIDDDMASRGGYRGGYNPSYTHKPRYHGDSRGYSQSPLHNSQGQSPYGAGRPEWNDQFSPSQQHPPHHHQGDRNFGPPSGPAAHYHSSQPHSPSYGGPPPHSGYRGGQRGGGFRGAAFNGRGGHRGSNFKSSQWGSSSQAGSGRDYPDDPSDTRKPPNDGNGSSLGDAEMDEDTSRPSRDSQVEDTDKAEKDDGIPRGPSGRPPPSGPSAQNNSSGKFSFAFKPSKTMPAAPKPEISQKFNAAPQRRASPQRRVSLDRSQNDRAPPPSAPKEPASARPRPDVKNPPEGPRMAPRMRKVKKTMVREKQRPKLDADLVASESVFFRKPGNESVVGSGTYGKVFKGLNVYTKGLVALKRIRMEGERDGFPVTAVREIKLLQSLRHTNIVNLQEVMVERNDCFMVFEYLSHDLTGLLNHPSFKLEAAQKKHLAKQLFEGLDYLHNRGVLHRDIKAANILVSNEGILKLADFGLARFYAKHHRLDYTNRVITIWYRSPELLLGETQYSAAVDVWSAACVMVEIFTRHAIFPGDGTELSQLDKIYNILGTPNLRDWPGLVDMAWFELLKPTAKKKNVFAEKYKDRVTPAAFELLAAMFCFDPAKRPTASEVLQHAYFHTEEPLPKQAIELSNIDGDWHEFESKALRKENERRDREARKASKENARDKDRKRPNESNEQSSQNKRLHVEDKTAPATSTEN